jgi:aryl-alcohol dehydrogenase-like predicted oxidoreductase
MQQRRLGRTGYVVNSIGHGTWALAGGMWRDIEPRDAQKALLAALELGVDFVDTALVYGVDRGDSEKLVGEALRDARARDRVVTATKVPPANDEWPGDGAKPLHVAFPARHVQTSVEQSLRNLKLEVIPIAQLHVWHDAWLQSASWPEVRGTFERLIREGKVLHWGISANGTGSDDAIAILDEPIIETVQVIYNLFDRGAEQALLAKAKDKDVGVIVRCPLDEGTLGGELGADATFPPGDWRNGYFRAPRLAEAAVRLARLAALVEITPPAARSVDPARAVLEASERERRGSDRIEATTVAELALRFVLARDEVSVVIPGMRTAEHVRANLAAGDGRRLTPALLERLAEHAWEKNWYA